MNPTRQRLQNARLYLVCAAQPDAFLDGVLGVGVDLVQLRMKEAQDEDIIQTGRRFRARCSAHDALFILNDRPDLMAAVGADGVHVGQDDMAVPSVRELVGPDALIGLSTHTPEQVDQAAGADYIGVGPVFHTPTKPGRPAVGLELVAHAARHARVPFFAIGGISPDNVRAVHDAGANRVAVVRALTDASAPALVAQRLREALTQESLVGST